jgi:nicotinamidase-related amidase
MVPPTDVLSNLAEKVRPEHTSVLVIDMQRDFMCPGLFSNRLGQDVSDMPLLAGRVAEFLDEARTAGVPIVHVRADYAPEWMSGPMWERLWRHHLDPYCQPGTEGIQFYPGLEPREGEPVITKHRFDAFFDTDLDSLLRSTGTRTVVLAGVATHCCVDATARHAYFLDYYVVLGRDLTGGPSATVAEATFETMDKCFGVVAYADEIVKTWH